MSAFIPVEALSALSAQAQSMVESAQMPAVAAVSVSGAAAPDGSFAKLVTDGVSQVNQQLIGSQTDLQKLAVGDVQNLHQVLINMEESRLSFQLMMQVRSRLLEAYQDVMRMSL